MSFEVPASWHELDIDLVRQRIADSVAVVDMAEGAGLDPGALKDLAQRVDLYEYSDKRKDSFRPTLNVMPVDGPITDEKIKQAFDQFGAQDIELQHSNIADVGSAFLVTYSLDSPAASKPIRGAGVFVVGTGPPVNISVTSTGADLTDALVKLVLDTLQKA